MASAFSPLPRCCRFLSVLVGGLLFLGLANDATANPFTLSAGRLAFDVSYGFDAARWFWDVQGNRVAFSLDGKFSSQSVYIGARYGLIDGLEAQFRGSYKTATYTATPIHLYSNPSSLPATGSLTDTVFNFSGQESGISDLYLGLSYRPLRRWVNLAIASELKIPTGYRAPSGTLCANLPPDTVRSLLEKSIRDPANPAVTPDLFCTGATLGDGQVDWLWLLELGKFISKTRTFIRADLGMNFRFQGPGQQLVAGLKVGEDFAERVVLYAGSRLAYTVNTGAPIGTTIDSALPEAAASAYPGDPLSLSGPPQRTEDLDKLLIYNVASRDRSYLTLDVGVILRLMRNFELRASYSRTLWGINFPELESVYVGFAVATR